MTEIPVAQSVKVVGGGAKPEIGPKMQKISKVRMQSETFQMLGPKVQNLANLGTQNEIFPKSKLIKSE